MVEVLPDLAPLLVGLIGLAFCYLAIYCAKAFLGNLSGTLGKLPVVGGWIDSGIHSVQQHIVHIFASAANSCQSLIGYSFHLMARQIDWLGREINSHANLLALISNLIPGVGLVRTVLAAIHAARAEIARIWHSLHSLPHAVARPIYGELKALERWTYPRVKAAERAIDVTIPKDIAGLRSRTKTIEGELSRLWDAIRAEKAVLATTAFVGAVALALSRLGMGWLRCDSATQLGKKYGCNLWRHLEKLLPLGIFLTLAFDFPDFVRASRAVAIGIGDAVSSIEGVFDPHLEALPPPNR